MEYLLKASVVIVLFYSCYKLFLQKETFFEANRWFLLSGLVIAFLIPFMVIPIYVEQSPLLLHNFTTIDTPLDPEPASNGFTMAFWLVSLYLIGALVVVYKFIIGLASLKTLLKNKNFNNEGGYKLVKTSQPIMPFSFFKWIVYNPTHFNENELRHIINHEKAHAQHYHSIDVLLTHLATIVFWFNPFIWLYKKEIQQNLEFSADSKALMVSTCKKSYQFLLLKTVTQQETYAPINNFYNSLIKKRIVMLQKSKSSKLKSWKYTLILPVLALFLMSFNTKKVYLEKAPENTPTATTGYLKTSQTTLSNKNQVFIVTKDFKESDFSALKKQLKAQGITISFKNIKRNSAGEIIAIKIDAAYKTSNVKYQISNQVAITPIQIIFDSHEAQLAIFGTPKTEQNELLVIGKPLNQTVSGDTIYFDKYKSKVWITKDNDTIEINHLKSNSSSTQIEFNTHNDIRKALYIVDGKETDLKKVNSIDPNTIEKIEVLKDKKAVTLYGKKAKEGVVIITTKK